MTLKYPKPDKPFGYSYFPAEISFLPEVWSKEIYPDLVRYDHDKVRIPPSSLNMYEHEAESNRAVTLPLWSNRSFF